MAWAESHATAAAHHRGFQILPNPGRGRSALDPRDRELSSLDRWKDAGALHSGASLAFRTSSWPGPRKPASGKSDSKKRDSSWRGHTRLRSRMIATTCWSWILAGREEADSRYANCLRIVTWYVNSALLVA